MPKRVSVWNQIDVIGKLWMGGTAAYSYEPTASDVENMRDEDGLITREGVEAWLDTHSGDFQSVTDFSVDFGGAADGLANLRAQQLTKFLPKPAGRDADRALAHLQARRHRGMVAAPAFAGQARQEGGK